VQMAQAIVRAPAPNFAAGIASAIGGGDPDVTVALEQHEQYCEALHNCGLQLTRLAADASHPDSTFIEDTAVLTAEAAIVTRPGAASRRGETTAALESLRGYFDTVWEIKAPGTLDGGDVCEVDGDFFIGVSGRTNAEGARQLAALLEELGHDSVTVDIRASKTLLHLKTGLSYLGDGVFVVSSGVRLDDALKEYDLIRVAPAQGYAANCIRVNDHLLIATGYPQLLATLETRGYRVATLGMSEFRKMDGGLSCLSLRF
jgi:dimethylargininase